MGVHNSTKTRLRGELRVGATLPQVVQVGGHYVVISPLLDILWGEEGIHFEINSLLLHKKKKILR